VFELFRDPPGLDEMRASLRKQLGLDHSRVLDAAKSDGNPRPPFPRLWVITAGRPERVLGGYGLSPSRGFPSGFYDRDEADACGIVVLRELPRERESLILRLMGAGAVLNEALAELDGLPAEAWERAVAITPLIEARFKIQQDGADEAEREFLMSTQDLYEECRQKTEQIGVERGIERGIERNAKQYLLETYETRFGAIPAELRAAVEATHDAPTLHAWFKLVITRSAEEIAAAIHASRVS
jgi:hypothetical protein